MSTAKLLFGIAENLKGNIRSKTIYNQFWLLNCIMEEAFAGTFKDTALNFPENAQWFCNFSTASYLHITHEIKGNQTQIYNHVRIIVGDFEVSQRSGQFLEMKPNCSNLYVIEDLLLDQNSLDNIGSNETDWVDKIANVMNLVYEGIQNKKITKIPKNLGYYELRPKNIHFKFIQKEELKKEFISKFDSPFFNRPEKFLFMEKEKLNWFKNNYEVFIDAIDLELITWEDLIISIQDPEKRKDFEQFYKKCIINLFYL